MDMEEQKGKISDWLREKKTIQFIRTSFNKFLRHFKDDNGHEVYDDRINEMVSNNRQSLEVTYSHISVKMPTLAIWIAELPSGVLPILN
jgi:DNA replicative helicase MCM subunit Mcm2 (Cdc46/Mcm family)